MSTFGEKILRIYTIARVLVIKPRLVRKLLSTAYKGYLFDVGWIASVKQRLPIDAKGEPLPWLTYPMLHILNERLTPEMSLFEFGGGQSTLYFSRRVRSVTTVEHNPEWYDYLKKRVPANCRLLFQKLVYDGDYARSARNAGTKFDVIVVDGRDRVNCARFAVEALTDGGVIVFDDFERERYQDAALLLAQNGFKQLNLWGMKPGLMDGANTALFYRSSNVFGL